MGTKGMSRESDRGLISGKGLHPKNAPNLQKTPPPKNRTPQKKTATKKKKKRDCYSREFSPRNAHCISEGTGVSSKKAG